MNKCLSLLLLLWMGLFSSCLREELPGMEADILQVTVVSDHLGRIFPRVTAARQMVLSTTTDIVFVVSNRTTDADLNGIQLNFKLTPGARLSCREGDSPDFKGGKAVVYDVTSEDGHYQRTYTVRFMQAPIFNPIMDFDHYELERKSGRYYIWYGVDSLSGDRQSLWASGNEGFALTNARATPDEYPTTICENGVKGYGVQLKTRSTGMLGKMAGKPIAAGNLFLGTFNVQEALAHPLASTQFGIPINRKPLRFSGYYKWEPGAYFTDRAGNITPGPGRDGKDAPNVYAVLYRNTDSDGSAVILNGSNVLKSSFIVAKAVVTYFQETGVSATDAWAKFDVAFDYSAATDPQLIREHGYSLAIVFTSSSLGAEFSGAIGSTLLIDECRISY